MDATLDTFRCRLVQRVGKITANSGCGQSCRPDSIAEPHSLLQLEPRIPALLVEIGAIHCKVH